MMVDRSLFSKLSIHSKLNSILVKTVVFEKGKEYIGWDTLKSMTFKNRLRLRLFDRMFNFLETIKFFENMVIKNKPTYIWHVLFRVAFS